MEYFGIVQKPKGDPCEASQPKIHQCCNYWAEMPLGCLKEQLEPNSGEPNTLNPVLDSLSMGPKGQNDQLSTQWLKICCQWDPHYVIFLSQKRRTMHSYFLHIPEAASLSSLSLFKPFYSWFRKPNREENRKRKWFLYHWSNRWSNR